MEPAGLMSTELDSLWRDLTADVPTGEAVNARLLCPDRCDCVFGAIDSQKRRHLLVALQRHHQPLKDVQSRGLSIDTRLLGTQLTSVDRFIDVVCLDDSGAPAFDLIGFELAQAIGAQLAEPAEVVAHVIAKWRRFWNAAPREMLSREEIMGLFAEVWCLRHWLLPFAPATAAVDAWKGPSGQRHDFEFPSRHSLEVKATTSDALIHQINGIDQLEQPAGGKLYLLSLQLVGESNAAESLPGIIEQTISALAGQPAAQSEFETKLIQAGFRADHAADYDRLRWRIRGVRLFHVDDQFPKITGASFAVALPTAVTAIRYSISLSGYAGHSFAEAPSKAVAATLYGS